MAAKVSYAFLFLSLILSQSESAISSGFEFIKPLQGSKKGDKVEGLYNLKKYLKAFGYIDDLPYDSSSPEADYFSGQLESAVRTYQTNFHLNSTGVLDADTVSQMAVPRCGVPDIINGTNWMRRRMGAVPQFSFYPGSPWWPHNKTVLKYEFASSTPDKFFTPVRNAIAQWRRITGRRFAFVRINVTSADLKFQLFAGDHGDGYPFDGPGGVTAHSFPPAYGLCHFDAEENWEEFGPPANGWDIHSIALHEIGHLLGLGHSAVMWPHLGLGERKRLLRYDDVQGIRVLYGLR